MLGFAALAFASCSDSFEKAKPVPAKPGIVQPDSGGNLLGEDEACQRVTAAEEARRRSLMCNALSHAACPVYVRPAGTGCWRYSESSVAACEAAIGDFTSCLDFDEHRCVITAFPADAPSCSGSGAGGGGGEGGV
jgi:hypothetical protein